MPSAHDGRSRRDDYDSSGGDDGGGSVKKRKRSKEEKEEKSTGKFSSYYKERFGSTSPEEYMNLRFSHFDPRVHNDDIKGKLEDMFRKYGQFEVKIIRNTPDQDRLAYVNFVEPKAAKKARKNCLAKLAGSLGKHLRIDPAGVVRDQAGRYLKNDAMPDPPHMLGGNRYMRGGPGGYYPRGGMDPRYMGGGGGYGMRGGGMRGYGGYGGPPDPDDSYGDRGSYRRHQNREYSSGYGGSQGSASGKRSSAPTRNSSSGRERRSRSADDYSPPDRGEMSQRGIKMDIDTYKYTEGVQEAAARTLFLGNLPLDVTRSQIKKIFGRYGVLEDVDIKTPNDSNAAYGFVTFETLDMAVEAKYYEQDRPMRSDGKHRMKIGYGKPKVTSKLWIGGLGPWVSMDAFAKELDRYGLVENIQYREGSTEAYVLYATADAAADACKALRGFPLGGKDRCIRAEFASSRFREGDAKEGDSPGSHDENNGTDRGRKRHRRSHHSSRSSSSNSSRSSRSPPRKDKRSKRSGSRTPGGGPRTPPDSPPRSPGGNRVGISPKMAPAVGIGKERPRVASTNIAATTVPELDNVRSPCWTGALVLKKSAYAVRLYKLTGEDDLIDGRLRDARGESVKLHVSQRLPIAGSAGIALSERFSQNYPDQFAYMIATGNPNASDATDLRLADSPSRPLKALIQYFSEKTAAGVVSLADGAQLYVLPQGDFADSLLAKVAPNVSVLSNCADSVLLIILARTAASGTTK